MKNKKVFVKQILEFWDFQRRDFPWRDTADPYKIFLTEILLRKTTSYQVNLLYDKFFDQYPTLAVLAEAKAEDLENILKPLGLYKQRSEQLIKLSNNIMEEYSGVIPESYDELIKLSGVGMYTAGGFLCLAYNKNVSMVDRNVIRVITRFFNFKSTKKDISTDKSIWKFVKDLIPKGKCREFNLGLIDFASAICIPRKPKCDICFLNDECVYFNNI